MLLALFLHPAHNQASRKLLNKTPLTTIGSLCRIGVYYFKRYNIDQDVFRLYEDLAAWIKGDDDATLAYSDFQSTATYWRSMVADMPGSKLPQLVLTVLAFAVNTATCERYFSELAMIHTAKRNRMSPTKARKLTLVRKRVREMDQARCTNSMKRRKLIAPAECTLLRERDDRFESSEHDVDYEEDDNVEEPDGALEYWTSVLGELEPDDDPQVPLRDYDSDTATSPSDAATRAAREFALKVQEIKTQSAQPIPARDQRPFPNFNDLRFPQEKSLEGLRGQKVSLRELSGMSSASSIEPGKTSKIP
ncbi:hypothetical protein PHMEG_0007227 [Phytophthora megakarya]|uniref:HAT C-terminal dimerisation domain-containing protein n=1 Tax=Phytophthora megakarya TaxID=4795 RepID=A0A225WLW3_9STRA|nr:hypothetical protein PHMEG_0007227 [Phytophthora megakarya]